MLLPKEKELWSEIREKVELAKPNWNVPHTLASVDWIRKLIEKEGGDEKILVTAMYLHDIGYELARGYDFKAMMKGKESHEQAGAAEAERTLRKLGGYSEEEIKEIVNLVKYHDHINDINNHNRQLVMEADSLAAIDWQHVKPNFDRGNCIKYLKHFKETRPSKFRTKTGKEFLKEVLKRAEEYLA